MAVSGEQLIEMWNNSCFLMRLVASSVKVAETAGTVIKKITSGADLKIIDKGTNGKKDLQTEADRAAQFCIEQSLQKKFENKLTIVGEEEITSAVPNIELDVSSEVLALAKQCPSEFISASPDDIVVWVDPLDGTSEFARAALTNSRMFFSNLIKRLLFIALLVQVTVLIGITLKGRSVAGVIHQPFYGENGRTIWAVDGLGVHGIDVQPRG